MENMKRIAAISIFAFVLLNTAYGAETSAANRPAHWAMPIRLEGVPNLHKISDSLYRSAQPSAGGMKNLKTMGIETIVNLRSFHSDRAEIGDTGLAHEHIYVKAWHPEEEEAVRFLQIATNPKRSPVLMHCQHGADRTGTMVAPYRVSLVYSNIFFNSFAFFTGGRHVNPLQTKAVGTSWFPFSLKKGNQFPSTGS
jgi:protein tyrosine phosphatase (PTP) superfamily phosphohydrolase (DUF442 family)